MSEGIKEPGVVAEEKSDVSLAIGPQGEQPHRQKSFSEVHLDFDKQGGLVPAIVQDHRTKEVLMLGFMNPDAWERTVRTGLVTFWSRSRRALWTKGETSGNYLRVRRLWIDCDSDTVLIEAEPKGPTCHTGARSCFFEEVTYA